MARRINPKIEQKKLPYKLYYFICEDAKSMQYYLDGLKKQYDGKRVVIKFEKAHSGSDAKSVQKSASEKRKEFNHKKESYPNGYVVVACFDKDDNNIADIRTIIAKNQKLHDMATIYNSPCYEYWLLLHTGKISQCFTSSNQCCIAAMDAIKRCYRQNFQDLDKFKSYKHIYDIVGKNLSTAIQNAKSLNFTDDDLEGTFTNAHIVFEEIIKLVEQE